MGRLVVEFTFVFIYCWTTLYFLTYFHFKNFLPSLTCKYFRRCIGFLFVIFCVFNIFNVLFLPTINVGIYHILTYFPIIIADNLGSSLELYFCCINFHGLGTCTTETCYNYEYNILSIFLLLRTTMSLFCTPYIAAFTYSTILFLLPLLAQKLLRIIQTKLILTARFTK